ncbi:YitT family protein [Pseudodesulfovibrio sp. zrk46]|uniref:YitT family protein n=1 Tax=Pseudodesulfovibrio sp. zrk46 TaxID=2725288 RepID=UPI00144A15E0|nr:YitT family protein [Pseudodesulfovibrio sp. zrk46]QJB56777.1 YitT family protein [Pseudodesulfovibrio sp. zrk46]
MDNRLRSLTDSLAWNVFLLCLGAFVYVVGFNGIAAHHEFIPGALYGLAVVGNNFEPELSLAHWYFFLNVPLFLTAWKGVSRRFFFLSLFTMVMVTMMTSYVHVDFGIRNEMYAAIAAGAIMGAGCGIILRTYGGGGGLDVLAVILNRKYGVRFGVFYFFINAGVMGFALSRYTPDKIIASLVMLFISSVVTEYVLSLFNQRKAVRILTKKGDELTENITRVRKMHATVFPGKGGYTGDGVDMVFSVTDNLRLRSLEQAVFEIDPEAIFIVENTFSVLGGNIARRKEY